MALKGQSLGRSWECGEERRGEERKSKSKLVGKALGEGERERERIRSSRGG